MPSVKAVPFLTHQGKVPVPDFFSTFGALGAVGSASIAHWDVPRPVTPAIQPAGSEPIASWSKVIVSAATGSEAIISNDAIVVVFTFTSDRDHGRATVAITRDPSTTGERKHARSAL